jgi:ABC-type cobalamin transport system ATPase subunit
VCDHPPRPGGGLANRPTGAPDHNLDGRIGHPGGEATAGRAWCLVGRSGGAANVVVGRSLGWLPRSGSRKNVAGAGLGAKT